MVFVGTVVFSSEDLIAAIRDPSVNAVTIGVLKLELREPVVLDGEREMLMTCFRPLCNVMRSFGDTEARIITVMDGSNVTFNNIRFSNKPATAEPLEHAYGGAVRVHGSSIAHFADCEFVNITTEGSENGGAVRISASSRVTFRGCAFVACTSNEGGAVYLDALSGSEASFTQCMFTRSAATKNGGAVYAGAGSRVEFSSCDFLANTATAVDGSSTLYGGGAVYIIAVQGTALTTANFSKCRFNENLASKGGGVLVNSADMPNNRMVHTTFADVNFEFNSATGWDGDSAAVRSGDYGGGGVHLKGGEHRFSGVSFRAGNALIGAGMYLEDASLELVNASLVDNTAAAEGGGIFVLHSTRLHVNGCAFERNQANSGAAMHFVDVYGDATNATCVAVTDTYVVNNTAVGSFARGAGMLIEQGYSRLLDYGSKKARVCLVRTMFRENSVRVISQESTDDLLSSVGGLQRVLSTHSSVMGCGGALTVLVSVKNQIVTIHTEESVFEHNRAPSGGGICLSGMTELYDSGSLFSENLGVIGGAINAQQGCKIVAEGTRFVRNGSPAGKALNSERSHGAAISVSHFDRRNVEMRNLTFAENESSNGGLDTVSIRDFYNEAPRLECVGCTYLKTAVPPQCNNTLFTHLVEDKARIPLMGSPATVSVYVETSGTTDVLGDAVLADGPPVQVDNYGPLGVYLVLRDVDGTAICEWDQIPTRIALSGSSITDPSIDSSIRLDGRDLARETRYQKGLGDFRQLTVTSAALGDNTTVTYEMEVSDTASSLPTSSQPYNR